MAVTRVKGGAMAMKRQGHLPVPSTLYQEAVGVMATSCSISAQKNDNI